MSEPLPRWRVHVTEYHGRSQSCAWRPYRTRWRKRLRWRRLGPTHIITGGPDPTASAIRAAAADIPKGQDYEVVGL